MFAVADGRARVADLGMQVHSTLVPSAAVSLHTAMQCTNYSESWMRTHTSLMPEVTAIPSLEQLKSRPFALEAADSLLLHDLGGTFFQKKTKGSQ
jgi:hypothetical protein